MKNRKNIIICTMCIALLLLATGYAILSSNLNIKGMSSLTDSWGVRITKIESTPSGAASNINDPVYTDTTINFEVAVKAPGDKMTFSVTVENYGSLNAVLQNINMTDSGESEIINSVNGITEGEILKAGTSKTFTITTEFDINVTDLPSGLIENLTVELVYVQDDTQVDVPDNYYIAYDANGGEGVMYDTLCLVGKDCTVAMNKFTRQGYGFIGWSKTANGDAVYTNEQVVKDLAKEGTVTLYAVWGTIYDFSYTGDIQTFVANSSGTYRLEVWGGQGGDCNVVSTAEHTIYSSYGGKGGYSVGEIYLAANTTLYVVVGGAGEGIMQEKTAAAGGYNGGGSVNVADVNHVYGAGGGATHIATATGVLSSLSSNRDAVLIVAGGGGGGRDQPNHEAAARFGNGGAGGGTTGIAAIGWGATISYTYPGSVGTQNTGYAFGLGQTASGNGAGGGGWYGGYHGTAFYSTANVGPGSGGSGYIKNTLSNAKTIAGNELIPAHNGASKIVGNSGNGFAKITKID